MTNREKFAEQILDIACNGDSIAVNKVTSEPIACYELECKDYEYSLERYNRIIETVKRGGKNEERS